MRSKKTAFGNSVSALALPRSRNAWQTNKATQRNAWLFGQWTSLSPEQKEAEKSAIKKDQNKLRETYSATAMMQKHGEEMAKAGLSNYDEKFNPFIKSAAEEQARAVRNTERKMKTQESPGQINSLGLN